MNVYDFDKTIFYPDSSVTFLRYLFRRNHMAFVNNAEEIALGIWESIKSGDPTRLKEAVFSVIAYIPDIDSQVEQFWEDNFKRLQGWYLKQRNSGDVVVSAGPEFLLKPLADMLGFELIATPMDKYTGRITGINNKGEEKVRRFKEKFGDTVIDEFYSDSLSDMPMAKISRKAFMVKNGSISKWPK